MQPVRHGSRSFTRRRRRGDHGCATAGAQFLPPREVGCQARIGQDIDAMAAGDCSSAQRKRAMKVSQPSAEGIDLPTLRSDRHPATIRQRETTWQVF
jgi:hypothetical protein